MLLGYVVFFLFEKLMMAFGISHDHDGGVDGDKTDRDPKE